MKNVHQIAVVLLVLLCSLAVVAHAEDYLRLKNGQTIKCAVLRQDTIAVYTTDWNLRAILQPPMQVYTRGEVESIWFDKPFSPRVIPYVPQSGMIEGGGSIVAETFADNSWPRSYGLVISAYGSFTVLRQLSAEVELNFDLLHGNRETWNETRSVLVNAVVHPVQWHGLVPFALFGGGSSNVAPGAIERFDAMFKRELLDTGLGVKYGANHIGYRLEWRQLWYNWTTHEKDYVAYTYRGNVSSVRATIFTYW